MNKGENNMKKKLERAGMTVTSAVLAASTIVSAIPAYAAPAAGSLSENGTTGTEQGVAGVTSPTTYEEAKEAVAKTEAARDIRTGCL